MDNSPKQNSNEQLLYQPEHDVPEDQPVQSVPEDPPVHHQPNSTLTLKVKKPAHLRERWIVAEPETVKPIKLQRDFDGNYKVMQFPHRHCYNDTDDDGQPHVSICYDVP